MVIQATATLCMIAAIGFGSLWLRVRERLSVSLRILAEREASYVATARASLANLAQMREMIDTLPMPIWRRDRGGDLVDCNQAYAASLGATRQEVLAGARELAPMAKGPSAAPTGPAQSEPVHLVIAGHRRLFELTEVPCAAGGTIGFARDCTDVESARATLRRHVNAHADVLESIYAAVAIYGQDGRLTFFNHSFARLWQIEETWLATEPTLSEILERLRESRRLPEFADFRAFKRERCEMFTSLIEPRHELMHLPDGRTLQLTISPHPFGGLTFVYDDVSDRLALECSYNTLIQVQRATLDHLFEGIAVYGGDGRLKLHNPAFRAMWGLSDEDVAGEPHISEIAEMTRDFAEVGSGWAAAKDEFVAQVIAPSLTSGLLYRRDGSMLQVASVPLPDGEVLLTYLDVSDTARVERALRERNEALETAGRLKSEFIASVSHELRTPLNTVIGFAEILNNQYFGSLNSSQSEYCGGVLDSAHQLMSLINDILDLATIEAGYMVLERGPVDIRKMLQSVVTLAQERASSRGLNITLRCPPQIGAIEADERRLKQALFNLISNALKFTPPGGAISIEARRCGGEVLMAVADTAIGIASADQARMFEESACGKRQAGSGLGLSLVKSLVELHGGSVEIEAAKGRGTRVTCRLPLGPPIGWSRKAETAASDRSREAAKTPTEVAA
jgi:signal transduction histidine kinase